MGEFQRISGRSLDELESDEEKERSDVSLAISFCPNFVGNIRFVSFRSVYFRRTNADFSPGVRSNISDTVVFMYCKFLFFFVVFFSLICAAIAIARDRVASRDNGARKCRTILPV